MAKANEIKRGMAISYNNKLLLVKDIDAQTPMHVVPPLYTKCAALKFLPECKVEKRFKSDDIIETVLLSRRPVTFSQANEDGYVFMDEKDYTLYHVKQKQIAEAVPFIPEEGIAGIQ